MKSVEIWSSTSKKKTFKDYTILYMYIAREQGSITPGGQNFDCNKKFTTLIIHC